MRRGSVAPKIALPPPSASSNSPVDRTEESKDSSDEGDATNRTNGESTLDIMEKGRYFGEISLMTKLKRTATCRALDFCTLSTLSKESLQQMSKEYPQIYMNFRRNLF